MASDSVELLSSGFYVNPGSMMAIGIIFPVIGILMVSTRFFTRIMGRLEIGPDDWFCVPALAFLCTSGAIYIWAADKRIVGLRLPPGMTWDQLLADPDYNYLRFVQVEMYCNFFSNLSTGMIRLSFIFFYRRIFVGRVFNITSWAFVGLITAWLVGSTIAFFTVADYAVIKIWKGIPPWSPAILNSLLLFIGGLSIPSFILDLLILSLPFPWIWRLQMRTSQKLAVSSIFLCGVFIVVAGAIRMMNGIAAMTTKPGEYRDIFGLKAYGDLLGWANVWLFWSYIENGTGMIVCCLPSLKLIFNKTAARKLKDRASSFASLRYLIPSSSKSHMSSTVSADNASDASEKEKAHSRIEVTRTVDQYTVASTLDVANPSTPEPWRT